MTSKCLMLLGSCSDAGKTMLVAALCRLLARRGLKTAPFKSQNMSGNAFITSEGLAISRAQAMQAEAAGVVPAGDMNPIMLVPRFPSGYQVTVRGQSWGVYRPAEYDELKKDLKKPVIEAFHSLLGRHEAVIIEGAGSCSEINLKERDLVNFGLATALNAPAVLVADLSRGGVFAQIAGARVLMDEAEQRIFRGVIVNKLRGSKERLAAGLKTIEQFIGRPVLGVVPFFDDLSIDSEDSLSVEPGQRPPRQPKARAVNVAALNLGLWGDLLDLNTLDKTPELILNFLQRPEELSPDYNAVVLPASPNPLAAARALWERGWPGVLKNFRARGGHIWALGASSYILFDQLELNGESVPGLGLLKGQGRLEPDPRPRVLAGTLALFEAEPLSGYRDFNADFATERPLDALVDEYPPLMAGFWENEAGLAALPLIGSLENGALRLAMVNAARQTKGLTALAGPSESPWSRRQRQYDLWADHVESHLDLERIMEIMQL